jgi:hypothetical protein
VPNYIIKLDDLIENNFSVIGRFKKEISDLIYTEGSLIEFIQDFLKCIKRIGNG